MIIISVSTSAKNPSAAVLRSDGSIKMKLDESGRPHSVTLMPLLDELLTEEGLTVNDADAFAVDIGPGSFTGVRIGVSTVNALAFAAKKKIIAVNSLAALRHAAPKGSTVISLIDARNENAYGAVYVGDLCIIDPCACTKNDIISACETIGILDEDGVLVGDCYGQSDYVNAELVIKEALRMLHENPLTAVTETSVPMYLRPSQAERMRERK